MVLVTGGTGLVGSHLIYKLIREGFYVKAIYRRKEKLNAVKNVFALYTENFIPIYNKIEWIEADITNLPKLERAFKDVEYVYHCAAFVSFEPDKYQTLRKINIEGTANIINLSLTHTIKKLCYVSSIATLGEALNNETITEETYWNSDADNSVYGITKYGAEMVVWRGSQEGLPVIIVNPGVILGAGFFNKGSGNLIKKVYDGLQYYTKGSVGFVDVENVINCMVLLMKSTIKNERYILISENMHYKHFFETVAKMLKVKPPRKEASPFLLAVGWRLDWLARKLFGKRRSLTKQLAKSLVTNSNYSNMKICKDLDYRFKPLEETTNAVCLQFLKGLP